MGGKHKRLATANSSRRPDEDDVELAPGGGVGDEVELDDAKQASSDGDCGAPQVWRWVVDHRYLYLTAALLLAVSSGWLYHFASCRSDVATPMSRTGGFAKAAAT
eukprot:5128870-Prymnesium_polylepis.1